MSQELFGRQPIVPIRPITADQATIVWSPTNPESGVAGQIVMGVTNFTLSYQQQVIKRRTLPGPGGRPTAVLYPTQPQGMIQLQRVFAKMTLGTGGATAGTHDIFNYPGWNPCRGTADLTITFDGASSFHECSDTNPGFRASGATVAGYQLSGEAEGLTLMDSVSIEFLQLFKAD